MDLDTKAKITDLERRLKLLESALQVRGGNVILKSMGSLEVKGQSVRVAGQAAVDVAAGATVKVTGAMIELN